MSENGTEILKCTCRHAGQDELHGAGMRVHNRAGVSGRKKASEDDVVYRCTVCSKERGK